MKKWEYKTIKANLGTDFDSRIDELDAEMKALGADGWELASSGDLIALIFKRELVEIDGKVMQPLKKSEPVAARPMIAEMAILGTFPVPSLGNAKMMKINVQCPDIGFTGEYDYAFSPSVGSMLGNPNGAPNHAAIAANIESKLREDLAKLGHEPSTIKWV